MSGFHVLCCRPSLCFLSSLVLHCNRNPPRTPTHHIPLSTPHLPFVSASYPHRTPSPFCIPSSIVPIPSPGIFPAANHRHRRPPRSLRFSFGRRCCAFALDLLLLHPCIRTLWDLLIAASLSTHYFILDPSQLCLLATGRSRSLHTTRTCITLWTVFRSRLSACRPSLLENSLVV